MTIKIQKNRIFSNVIFILVMLALIIGSAGFPTRVSAFNVTITVTTSADNTTADSQCSLREAITNANNNAATYSDCPTGLGSEFINFASTLGTATITLGSVLPAISDPSGLTIIGGGKITVSGNDLFQVFSINANVPLTLDGLTVSHGLGPPDGGGVYANPGSTLTINNSTFSDNHSSTAVDISSYGGGIDSFGTLIITNSTFSSNTAVVSGGGVMVSGGSLTVSNSIFSGNSASYGGGVRSLGGPMTITKSIFSGNSAVSYGGGIYNPVGTLAISESTFSSNTAGAGGAINNIGTLTLANSTFFGNSAVTGGAIYNGLVFGTNILTSTIANSTFSANSATIIGGGVANDARLILSNTIIANSISGGDCDNGGFISNSVNNLIEDLIFACDLTNGVNGNIIGSDPNLGPGTGSPVYLPLNDGSLAINTGNDAQCAAAPVNNTSQNGLSRPQGAHCDIGSYEADVTPPTVLSIVRADLNPTNAASVHFTVTFSEPVYGVTINDFTLTKTGLPGATVSSISSDTGSTRTVTVTTGSGSGTIRLDLVDRDSILDTANLYLGGTGLGNGSFTAGEVYNVLPYRFYVSLIRR